MNRFNRNSLFRRTLRARGIHALLALLSLAATYASAAEPGTQKPAAAPIAAWLSVPAAEQPPRIDSSSASAWQFEEAPLGFERRRMAAGMKVRGWRVKHVPNLYVGQARVGRKWGLGLVMEHGDMAFGMNHRGIELRKAL